MTIDLNRRNVVSAMLAGSALLVPGMNAIGAETERGVVGRSAPALDVDFWLDGDGEPAEFDLADHRGKWVYLKCWQGWCPACHSHGFPTLQKIVNEFSGEERFVPVAVQTVFEGFAVNTPDRVREMQLRYELPIYMGHDTGSNKSGGHPNTMVAYRTGGTPWQVLIDPGGTVVFNGFHVDADNLIAYVHQSLSD